MKKKSGPKKGQRFGGRQKGTPNKVSRALKEQILEAAELAGGPEGAVGYLRKMAYDNSSGFMALLGRILPTQAHLDVNHGGSVQQVHKGMTAAEAAAAWAETLKAGKAP